MSLDPAPYLKALARHVTGGDRSGGPTHEVTLTRAYPFSRQELWAALTTPAQLAQWFLPVRGTLDLGGRYQLEGNAGGDIVTCEPLAALGLTWEFGDDVSWVDVALADAGAGTRLTLTHASRPSSHWTEYGPGAVGVGWELALLALARHLAGEPKLDEEAFVTSSEGRTLITGASEGWGQASLASGIDAAEAEAATRRTTAFYTGVSVDGD